MFEIRILELVDEKLGKLEFNGANVTARQIFNQYDILTFVPEPNVFNANATGGAVDEDGTVIGDFCDDNNRLDGLCPITFQYEVIKNNVISVPGTAQTVLPAVDDFGPTLVVNNINISVDQEDADQERLPGVDYVRWWK